MQRISCIKPDQGVLALYTFNQLHFESIALHDYDSE